MFFRQGERYLWVIFLLVATAKSSEVDCPKDQKCYCALNIDEDYEMYCQTRNNSAFILNVKPNVYVSLQCSDGPSWSDFNLSLTINPVSAFYIRLCELPVDFSLAILASPLNALDVETLVFQSYGNVKERLKKFHFSGFSQVTKLILSSNNISALPVDLFDDLNKLDWLELRENNIKHIPVEIFRRTPNLRILELGRNQIEFIDAQTFGNLTKLELLNIWMNRLRRLDENTFDNLTSLKMLDLSRNLLENLPVEIFAKLRDLKTLNLLQNNFSSLPAGLFRKNVNLQSIRLTNNKKNLTTLPDEFFANLTLLKTLKLSKNGLEFLPDNIFHASTSLLVVELDHNFLTSLPKNIFKGLQNLTTLTLAFNNLKSLPDGIFADTSQLRQLDLSNNHIVTISSGFFVGANSLRELNMNNNGLEEIHEESLKHLKDLRTGRFANNKLTLKTNIRNRITRLSPFHSCIGLTELYLAKNNISEIFADWTTNGLHLKKLDLSYNNISVLTVKDLHFVSNEINVDLSHNKIRRILLDHAEKMSIKIPANRAVNIYLGENPLICDCEVYDLLRNLEGEMGGFVAEMFTLNAENLRCHEPQELTGISVREFNSKTFTCILDNPILQTNCPLGCKCRFQPAKMADLLDCSYKNFTEMSYSAPNALGFQMEFNLRGNQLTKLPQIDAKNLSKLFLSDNNISDVSFQSLSAFNSSLKVLELHNNNLTILTPEDLNLLRSFSSLTRLTLHGNPWICDCRAKDFLEFVQTTKLVDSGEKTKITCGDGSVSIYDLTTTELCPARAGIFIGISAAVAFLGLAIGITAAFYYRYQQEIKVWLYAHRWCLWFVTEEELDKNKLYDAFISYSHKDEEFITNELQPGLENGPRPFKLCLHFRDWLAGEWIPTQIARSVEDSRRTIIVLSPNFLESVWGRMEFRAAHNQALSEGRARIIVILYGEIGSTDKLDPELKAYLSMNTYIKWGDPWFWDKLRYALPHPPELTKHAIRRWKVFEHQEPSMQVQEEDKKVSHISRY